MPAPLSVAGHTALPVPSSSCPDLFHCCPVQFRPTGRTACVAEGFRWIGRLGPRISARRRLPHHVMPGLVPGIHVLRHRGARRERARRRRGVDARNKSGHDGGEGGACRKPARANALHRVRPTLTGHQWNESGHDGRTEETPRVSRPPCGGDEHACDRHRHRRGAPDDGGVPRHADPRIGYADSPVPRAHGRHLPTAMSTGGSSRQMSTFPPGIRGTRMPTR